ncbi:MAG: hypothetical protein ACE5G0_01265 [Rhodothermales bacterium]
MKIRGVPVVLFVLGWSLLLPARVGEGHSPDDPIAVRVYIVKGSIWESVAGQDLIRKEVVEARRIWFANVGVKLSIKPKYTLIEAEADALAKEDITRYAATLQAGKRNIVVVFTNKSWKISRAWTEEPLVEANTPVIIVGRQVYDKPGTHRDLAHELGHVLLRDPAHSPGINDLMNITWAPENGEVVTAVQKRKALTYPN